jgi:hypothetical protein
MRLDALSRKRIPKYFAYALGEIILVVIGILIALQINNWNEKRVEKVKSKEYHQRIIEDLDLIIKFMDQENRRSEKVQSYITASIDIIQNRELTKENKDSLDYAFVNYYQLVQINDNLKSIEELKSSGQFGLIYNKELRSSIDNYTAFLSAISKIFKQLSSEVNDDRFIEERIFNQLAEKIDNNTVVYDFESLKEDPTFVNRFSKFAVCWQTKKDFTATLSKMSEVLKAQLENELKILII